MSVLILGPRRLFRFLVTCVVFAISFLPSGQRWSGSWKTTWPRSSLSLRIAKLSPEAVENIQFPSVPSASRGSDSSFSFRLPHRKKFQKTLDDHRHAHLICASLISPGQGAMRLRVPVQVSSPASPHPGTQFTSPFLSYRFQGKLAQRAPGRYPSPLQRSTEAVDRRPTPAPRLPADFPGYLGLSRSFQTPPPGRGY